MFGSRFIDFIYRQVAQRNYVYNSETYIDQSLMVAMAVGHTSSHSEQRS
jgi:hypothetical protein